MTPRSLAASIESVEGTEAMKNFLRFIFQVKDSGHPEIKTQPIPPVGKQKRRARGTASTEYQAKKWGELGGNDDQN